MKIKTNEELSNEIFWLKVEIFALITALAFMCYVMSKMSDKISDLYKPQTISNPYKTEVLLGV